ncbi:hypothetical protein JMJ77_0005842, partial [Colletotrichum scovillei]
MYYLPGLVRIQLSNGYRLLVGCCTAYAVSAQIAAEGKSNIRETIGNSF